MRKGGKLLVGGLQLIHLLLALLRHAAQIDFRRAATRVDVLSNDSFSCVADSMRMRLLTKLLKLGGAEQL